MAAISKDRFRRAADTFRKHHGILQTSAAIREGIHPTTLYAMRDAGTIEALDRGLYRLTECGPLSHPDLVPVAVKIPNGVLCLISALAFHELTTQVPHEVYLALRRGAEAPRLAHPPLRLFRFEGPAFTEGIERHQVDGFPLRVYCPEKTLADCFKFRNRVGLDTAVEALRAYRERGTISVKELLRFAAVCRVERVMRPYLEALL
jgi:predicted transcriptional regulator of viral defense system